MTPISSKTKNFIECLNTLVFARPDFFKMPDGNYTNSGWTVINGRFDTICFQTTIGEDPLGNDDVPDWMEILLTVDSIRLFKTIDAEFKERGILPPEKPLALLRHDNYGWIFPEVLKGRRF